MYIFRSGLVGLQTIVMLATSMYWQQNPANVQLSARSDLKSSPPSSASASSCPTSSIKPSSPSMSMGCAASNVSTSRWMPLRSSARRVMVPAKQRFMNEFCKLVHNAPLIIRSGMVAFTSPKSMQFFARTRELISASLVCSCRLLHMYSTNSTNISAYGPR